MAAVQGENCRGQWEWAGSQEATAGIQVTDDVVCTGMLVMETRRSGNSEYILRW